MVYSHRHDPWFTVRLRLIFSDIQSSSDIGNLYIYNHTSHGFSVFRSKIGKELHFTSTFWHNSFTVNLILHSLLLSIHLIHIHYPLVPSNPHPPLKLYKGHLPRSFIHFQDSVISRFRIIYIVSFKSYQPFLSFPPCLSSISTFKSTRFQYFLVRLIYPLNRTSPFFPSDLPSEGMISE